MERIPIPVARQPNAGGAGDLRRAAVLSSSYSAPLHVTEIRTRLQEHVHEGPLELHVDGKWWPRYARLQQGNLSIESLSGPPSPLELVVENIQSLRCVSDQAADADCVIDGPSVGSRVGPAEFAVCVAAPDQGDASPSERGSARVLRLRAKNASERASWLFAFMRAITLYVLQPVSRAAVSAGSGAGRLSGVPRAGGSVVAAPPRTTSDDAPAAAHLPQTYAEASDIATLYKPGIRAGVAREAFGLGMSGGVADRGAAPNAGLPSAALSASLPYGAHWMGSTRQHHAGPLSSTIHEDSSSEEDATERDAGPAARAAASSRTRSSSTSDSDQDSSTEGGDSVSRGRRESQSSDDGADFGLSPAVSSRRGPAAPNRRGIRATGRLALGVTAEAPATESLHIRASSGADHTSPVLEHEAVVASPATLAATAATAAAATAPVPAAEAPAPAPAPGRYIPPHLRKKLATPSAVFSPDSDIQTGAAPSATAPPVAATCSVHGGAWSGGGSERYAVWSAQGTRTRMEDAHVACEIVSAGDSPSSALSLFAVMDGHCGSFAAEFTAEQLPKTLRAQPKIHSSSADDRTAAVLHAFSETDAAFARGAEQHAGDRSWQSGTTALAVLASPSDLIIASLGDCRAVLASRISLQASWSCDAVSVEHSPLNERERIEACGGWVSVERELSVAKLRHMDASDPFVAKRMAEGGALRWTSVSRLNGELGVSRAIGDVDYKGSRMASYPWSWPAGTGPRPFSADLVLAVPEITHVQLPPVADSSVGGPMRFLIIACDGLWEVLTNEEAVSIVGQVLDSGTEAPLQERLLTSARRVVDLALKLGSSDNVTAMVVLV